MNLAKEQNSKKQYSNGIKSITFPEGFKLVRESYGGIGNRIIKEYSPAELNKDQVTAVSITFKYRGLELAEQSALSFRSLMKQTPQMIFQNDAALTVSPETENIICDLRDVLGRTSSNQILNRGTHYPIEFQLEELQTYLVGPKPVLASQGWFHDFSDDPKPRNHCLTIYFDANENSSECQIEELILQAKEWDDFEIYYSKFQDMLDTIEWNN